MKLQQFEGGLSSRLAPQLLNNNQGVVFENIDNATGVLTPIKDKLATDITLLQYHKYFDAESIWVSRFVKTDFVEFQRVLYLSDQINEPKKLSKGVYNQLGITSPTKQTTSENVSKAKPLKNLTVLNISSKGDLPAADLDYLLFNIKDNVYSTPFKFTVFSSSSESTRAKGNVVPFNELTKFGSNTIITERKPAKRAVTFKELKGDYADKAELYRFYDGEWYLVTTFDTKAQDVEDSLYNIRNNKKLDESLITPFDGVYQYVYTFYNSVDGSESVPSKPSTELEVQSGSIKVVMSDTTTDNQVTHKRLYRIGGNLAKFTLVAQLDVSDTVYIDKLKDTDLDGRLLESENFYPAPKGLKYLTESYAMLFGVVGSILRFTPIGKPNAWPPEYSVQFDQDLTGIGPVANGILVFTRSKTYIVTGTGPAALSQQLLRGDQGCISHDSIQEAIAGTIIWASEDGLCTSSGNNVTSITKALVGRLELDPVNSVVHDEVYYCHNSCGKTLVWDYRFQPILKWLTLGVQSVACADAKLYGYLDGYLYLLYKDTNNLTMKYKSPLFVEGSFSENKTYKKVYIRAEGDIILNIIIDNFEVASFNLTGVQTHQLQIPQQLQRGYSIQFEVEGIGIVHEIEYVASPRQNG